jgi:dihydrofolate reductase
MGRVIVEQVVSADGFAADRDGGIGFASSYFAGDGASAGLEQEQLRLLAGVGAIVLGRHTYRMFEAYWPQACPDEQAVAGPINTLPKYVVSSTLSAAPWGPRASLQILRGDGVEAVRALRRRTKGDIIVWGSLTLSDALLCAGQVDLLRLRMLPLMLGAGRSVWPADAVLRQLVPERITPFDNGCVLLSLALAPVDRGHDA